MRVFAELYRKLLVFLALPFGRKVLFVKAVLVLNAAWVLLHCLSFSRIQERLNRTSRGNSSGGRLSCEETAWAVRTAAEQVPWAGSCLPQAVAGCFLLLRAGYSVQIAIGVRNEGNNLEAHAWVKDEEGRVLVGSVEELSTFSELSRSEDLKRAFG